MRNIFFRFLFLLSVLCLIVAGPALSQNFRLNQQEETSREYLPGDFVHVIVSAPIDTAQMTATMPDGKTISLVHERRTNVWHGLWQVPIDFKAGEYSAKLNAVDLEGNVFEGMTDVFMVGRLALITLVEKGSPEAVIEKPKVEKPLQQAIKIEAPAAPGQPRVIVVTPSAAPPPKIQPEEKTRLIESNMLAGKAEYERGRFAEAAAYFRIVLFLEPANKEAGLLLAKAEEEIARREIERSRWYMVIFVGAIAFLILLAILFYLASRNRGGGYPPAAARKAASPEEMKKRWYQKMGWKSDPFVQDVLKQFFSNSDRLELSSFRKLIQTQIEGAGGKGIEPITEAALEKIFEMSKGEPREALKICGWAVNKAIEQDEEKITAEIVLGYKKIAFKKILIADDEEIVRTTLEGILKKAGGYDTDFAADGEEAIKKIKNNVYGLVLLDIAMPKLDGYAVLKQARETYPDLPIVFISGKGEAEKIMESLSKYNLTALVEKPFTVNKVLDTVALALKTKE